MRPLPRNILLFALICAVVHSSELSTCVFEGCKCEVDNGFSVLACRANQRFPSRDQNKKPALIDTIDMSSLGMIKLPDNQFNELKIDYLDLGENQLSHLNEKTFSNAEIPMIVLNQNSLISIHRDTFRPLKDRLKSLTLNRNKLSNMTTSDLSAVLEPLEHLTSLGLSHNGLIEIPDLSHMVGLHDLQLEGNHITSLLQANPDKFLLPDNLYTLALNENRIKELDSRWFQNLKKLKHLNLGSNQISHIDANIFGHLTNLNNLILTKNYIVHIPAGLIKPFRKLERLDLSSQNMMLKKIDGYAFDRESPEHVLETVDLSNNRIERLPAKLFCSRNVQSPYVVIKTLELAANNIKHLNPCLMQQLARGKSEHDGKHYIKTKVSFELNKALHTNMENIRCDCNVTYSAKLVELEGDCINKENTLIRLNNYQCSMLNALGQSIGIEYDIDTLCKSSHLTDCEQIDETGSTTAVGAGSQFIANEQTDQPRDQINSIVNTHTSSDKEHKDRKVTPKPSQIGGLTSGAAKQFSTLTLLLTYASTLMCIRL